MEPYHAFTSFGTRTLSFSPVLEPKSLIAHGSMIFHIYVNRHERTVYSSDTQLNQTVNRTMKIYKGLAMLILSATNAVAWVYITIDTLILLASKVMARTGSEYNSLGGHFDASKGELRKLNVTAGAGGRSYMNWMKVPQKLDAFCNELNARRKALDTSDIAAIYELSFWAHYELVTIHPWADGNGRTCRLLMNLLQMEYDVLPTKVLKEDKGEYIQSLIDTRENEDIEIFLNCMTELHCTHLKHDIEQYVKSVEVVDKTDLTKKMVDKWSIKPSLAGKLVDILLFMADKDEIKTETIVSAFGFTETTAKRYLRQLTEFGYLEVHGGNKNRTYSKKD